MNNQEQQVIIFVGRSGCGKGTQADLLYKNLSQTRKVISVATGVHFRELLSHDSLTTRLYKEAYTEGKLAPAFLVATFLGNIFLNEYTGVEHMIFDGVGRLQSEAGALTEMFEFYKIKNPKVIFIDVSSAWGLEKTLKRGRIDDHSAKTKDAWFDTQVVPVIETLKANPLYTFIQINGEQTIEEVHAEILSKL